MATVANARYVFSIEAIRVRTANSSDAWTDLTGLQNGTLEITSTIVRNFGGESMQPLAVDIEDAVSTVTLNISQLSLDFLAMVFGNSVSSPAGSRFLEMPTTRQDVYLEVQVKAQEKSGIIFGYELEYCLVNHYFTLGYEKGYYAIPNLQLFPMVNPSTNKFGRYIEWAV